MKQGLELVASKNSIIPVCALEFFNLRVAVSHFGKYFDDTAPVESLDEVVEKLELIRAALTFEFVVVPILVILPFVLSDLVNGSTTPEQTKPPVLVPRAIQGVKSNVFGLVPTFVIRHNFIDMYLDCFHNYPLASFYIGMTGLER